jgi:hypothetical protein
MRSYSPWILEAWATWEVLRKLGFKADDIFWEINNTVNATPGPGLTLNIVLRTQNRMMRITCSHRLEEAAKILDDSRVFQEAVNAGKFEETEMTEVLHASWVWENQAAFVLALGAKGFEFPFRLN